MTGPAPTRPEISVVIPCRNEEANAAAIAAAVIAELEAASVDFDLIFIDNASTDATVPIIRALCAQDPRIRLIINTRNFGQMASPTHGILAAGGRAVIAMCADFQDSPALIGPFIERWRGGADIVLGVRASERSGWLKGALRRAAYRFQRRFGDYAIIPDATGFGLYDARVLDAIRTLREPEPFFRGLLVETGYRIETIPFVRPPRAGGRSNNTFITLLDFALSGLTASGRRMLRLPFFLGGFLMLIALAALAGAAVSACAGGPVLGWLIAAAVQAQAALVFLFLGMLGDQVRVIGERTRNAPMVIERERVNFPDRP